MKKSYLCLLVTLALVFTCPVSGKSVPSAELQQLCNKAGDLIARGEFAEGERLSRQVLSVARQAGDRHLEAQALNLIGNACFYSDRQEEALDYFQASRSLMRETGDRLGEAVSLKDIGITLKSMGRFDEAFGPLYESLDAFRQLDAKLHIGSAVENIGRGYATLGAHNLAFEMYEEALRIARETGDATLLHGSARRIGEQYLETGNPRRALRYLTEALEVAERENLPPFDRAVAMMPLSNTLAELGRTEDAIRMRHRSMSLCESIRWKGGMIYNFQGLGGLYVDRDPARAIRYYEKAIEIGARIDFQPQWGSYAGLARAHRQLRDMDRAIECYQKAIENIESLRDHITRGAHRDTYAEKHAPVFRDMLEALMERHERDPEGGDDVRAFNVLERARSQALLAALAEARIDLDEQLDADLRQRRERLEDRITELQKRLFSTPVEGSMPSTVREGMAEGGYDRLSGQLSEAEQEYDRLIVEIKRRNPRYATLRYPDNLSLEEARALLDGQTALVAYSMTKNSVIAFVLTQTAFRAARLAVSPRALEARAQIYADLLSKDGGDGWRAISRRLYRDLVKPLRSEIGPEIERLVIVPDEALHYLPFETLIHDGDFNTADDAGSPTPDDPDHASRITHHARFLVEDFAISYVPSATVLNRLRVKEHPSPARDRADSLVLANPVMNETRDGSKNPASQSRALFDDEGLHIAPIPFAAAEARALSRYFGAGSEIHTGSEASESLIKAARLDRFRVIHFATHGLISQRAPARSALALAPSEKEDGFLQAREIYHLKLASDLVVLSACQTARGRVLSGEGVQGMARAFFHAGAKSVVASLWNVNDERTATFMEAFYRHLADGMSKAEALRAAKLDLLSDDAASAPRYWAAFILIGESQEHVPIGEGKGHYWGLALAAALFAALAAFIFLKRRFSRQSSALSLQPSAISHQLKED
ncbi:MAG: CHAT domain-containing protein [Blastocatellia bacterium]|nr:CHAT domain-containing protein [Blastocatellia bacterium]